MRILVAVLLAFACPALAEDTVRLHYDSAPHQENIAAELSLSITIEGTPASTNFVRSLHPLLSLNSFRMRAEGTHVVAGKKHKVEHDDARVAVRYDDEDSEYDWKRSEPPEDLAKNKLEAMIWYVAMGTRSYSLSALGEYRSDDPNQDHNGEALDLFANGITRLSDDEVKEGDTWTAEWKGSRAEKTKKAKWSFKQVAKLEKLEERDGRKLATVTSELTGTLNGDEDPAADEKWTRCEGKTRVVLNVASGWIHEQWGRGTITAYYRRTGDDGGKEEVTLRMSSEGKRTIRR